MNEFLSGIGFMAIMAAIIYLLLQHDKKRMDKIVENEKMFSHIGEEGDLDDTLPRHKAIEKALSQPGVRKAAEEIEKQLQRNRAINESNERKEKIIKRTFSYKYEDLVYEIFSPYAQLKKYPHEPHKWDVNEMLEKWFIVKEIERIQHITENEAYKLIDELIQNNLIYEYGDAVDWKKKCSLGYLLSYEWDIISRFDNNFTKWMDAHPNREERESAEKRRKEVINKRIEELSKYY